MVKKSAVIFLMGPTAIGKSNLAIQLKKKFSNLELLSVDSKLIYKDLNIGTDKPTYQELKLTPHGLLNLREPTEIYSVAQFRQDALYSIKNIISKKKIPFLVGGTMFYFNILLKGLITLPPSDPKIRQYIYKDLCQNNSKRLLSLLEKLDFNSFKNIHSNDIQRNLRALEVYFVSGGNKLSQFLLGKRDSYFPYKVFSFGIIPHDKKKLFYKIERRFQKMLKNGFEEEVQSLFLRKDLNFFSPSINSIGYKQMWLYLQKKYSYQEMIYETIKATRKLVKKQLTWIYNWKNITLIKDNELFILKNKIYEILTHYRV